MPKLTLVTPEIYPDLSQFLTNFPGETRSPPFWLDRFYLWWESNPAYSEGSDRGWILDNNGEIGGFFGFISSKFQIAGREITTYSTSTWRVLPEYRPGSLALFNKFVSVGKDSIILSTTPNHRVRQVLAASGFQLVPRKEHRRTNILINLRKYFITKLTSRGFDEKKLETFVPSWINRIPRLLVREMKTPSVKILQRAGEDFDSLWARTKDIYQNTNVRTAEVVNWYCFESEYFRKFLLGYYENGQLFGYMILWEIEEKYRTLECLDLWVDPRVANAEMALISASIDYATQHSFDMISLPYWVGCRKDRFKFGFYRIIPMKKKEYFRPSQKFIGVINENNSYFAWGHGDIGI